MIRYFQPKTLAQWVCESTSLYTNLKVHSYSMWGQTHTRNPNNLLFKCEFPTHWFFLSSNSDGPLERPFFVIMGHAYLKTLFRKTFDTRNPNIIGFDHSHVRSMLTGLVC